MADRSAPPPSDPSRPRAPKHTCHWPGCSAAVPERLWGCTRHWNRLPAPIRKAISHAYRPGQEITKTPSPAYVEAARAAQTWILTGRLPSGRSELEPDELPGAPAPPAGPVDPVPPDLSASAAVFDRLEAAAAPPRDCSAPCDVPFERPNFGGLVPPPGALERLRELGPETVLPRSMVSAHRPPMLTVLPPAGSTAPPRRVPLQGPIIDEEHGATFEATDIDIGLEDPRWGVIRRHFAEGRVRIVTDPAGDPAAKTRAYVPRSGAHQLDLPEDLDPEAPGLSPIERIRRRRDLETVRDRMAAQLRAVHNRTLEEHTRDVLARMAAARPVDPRGLDELGPRDVDAEPVERLRLEAEVDRVLDREAAELAPFLGDPERWLPRARSEADDSARAMAEVDAAIEEHRRRGGRVYTMGEFVTRTQEEADAEDRERRRQRFPTLAEFRAQDERDAEARELRRRNLRERLELPREHLVLPPAAVEAVQRIEREREGRLPPGSSELERLEARAGAPLGVCAVCRRTAPLVDSECPDCRH